jgi:vacuolar-type H+-ATPase subunit H
LQQAELSSKAVVDNARREGELILAEADQRANEMLQKAYDERTRLDNDLADLYARRTEILLQIERFLTTQTEQIRAFKDNEATRLQRAEPPRKRPTREMAAQPLPSDPPSLLAEQPAAVAAMAMKTHTTEVAASLPATAPAQPAEQPVVVELNLQPVAEVPATEPPAPAVETPVRKPEPQAEPVVLAALKPALQREAPRPPVQHPAASEPTSEAPNVLKQKRASFFEEALATHSPSPAVDDLLDEL